MAFEYLFLCTFLLHFDICSGYSLQLSGKALNDTSYTLTCTVTYAANIDDLIIFRRKTSAKDVASLKQTKRGCSVFSQPRAGYHAACGSGTQGGASDLKKYTLKIYSLAEEDSTDWWCYLQRLGARSNNYKLHVFIPCDWCSIMCWTLGSLVMAGVIAITVVVNAEPGETCQMITLIFLKMDGVALNIIAIITTVWLVTENNLDKSDWPWITAVIICAVGFLFGIIFSAFTLVEHQHQ